MNYFLDRKSIFEYVFKIIAPLMVKAFNVGDARAQIF